ncbi:hypothetical protein DM02DRAFT_526108, partial [Periconia macrospinosa]
VMGGMNYHIDVVFENGVVWLARIRRSNATSPPPGLRERGCGGTAEYATMRSLESVDIPTSKVFGFALENQDNPVGVGVHAVGENAWDLTL